LGQQQEHAFQQYNAHDDEQQVAECNGDAESAECVQYRALEVVLYRESLTGQPDAGACARRDIEQW